MLLAAALWSVITGDSLLYQPGVRLQAAAPIPDGLSEAEVEEWFEIVWRFR